MAKAMRDRFTQAVLPIHSTIKPAAASLDQILGNRDIQNIVATLGVGILLEPESLTFCLDHLRYERIIVAMGDGPKGASSRVVSLMESYFHPVVAAGHVYTASISEPNRLSAEELFSRVLSPKTRVLTQVNLS
jgi:DNA gyrase/topoisomerase IV subunit B